MYAARSRGSRSFSSTWSPRYFHRARSPARNSLLPVMFVDVQPFIIGIYLMIRSQVHEGIPAYLKRLECLSTMKWAIQGIVSTWLPVMVVQQLVASCVALYTGIVMTATKKTQQEEEGEKENREKEKKGNKGKQDRKEKMEMKEEEEKNMIERKEQRGSKGRRSEKGHRVSFPSLSFNFRVYT